MLESPSTRLIRSGILPHDSFFIRCTIQPVPMLDLKRQYATIRELVRAAIDQVCESQSLVLGEEVAALEREISAHLGVASTVGCSSGTDALWLALAGAGVTAGDSFRYHALYVLCLGQLHHALRRTAGFCRYRSGDLQPFAALGRAGD